MEDTKVYVYCGFLIILMVNIWFLKGVSSHVYTVGDDQEWDTGNNYGEWSRKYNFSVGDVLVFKYVKGQHNVYEVKEGTFRSCNASTGVLARYETGNDQVNLTEAKDYWFICDIAGHCLGGMRFTIEVKTTNSTDTNSTNAASPPQVYPTPSPNSSKRLMSYTSKRWFFGIYLVAFQILRALYCD